LFARGGRPVGCTARPSRLLLRSWCSPYRCADCGPEKERPPMPESQLPYCPVLVLTIRAAASILTKPPGAPSENSRPLRLTSQAMYRNPGRSVDGADRRALHLQPRTGRNFAPGSLHFLIGYDGSRYAGHAIGIKLETGPGYDPIRPYQTRSSDWALISLDTKLGSADRVLPMISEPPDVGSTIMLGGYQQDHPLVLMADTECRIVGRVTDAGGRLLLRHNCTRTSRQRRVLTDRERRQMVHGGSRCGRRTRCCQWASRRPRRSSRRL
jgi:hypothetical protein